MQERSNQEIFVESLNRCLKSEDFMPTFYGRFLNSSEEIHKKFIFTDFEKQHKLLARSLQLCASCLTGNQLGLKELTERAESHDRLNLDIKPELYEFWLSSLILTASEFDPTWNAEIESIWRKLLGYVIRHMTRHY